MGFPRSGQSPSRRLHVASALAAVFAAVGVFASAPAQAHTFASSEATDGASAAWTPDIVAAIDPYDGPLGLDHFAASNAEDEVGAVTAQLSNGDRVVAGLVPDGVGTTCSDGTALCSIGLVRYDASNHRVAWTNPGANGRFSNNYVVYPGGNLSVDGYQYIRDIKVKNGAIYVMVDRNDGSSGLGRQDVRIVGFNEDGSVITTGLAGVFGYAAGGDLSEDFYGSQMVVIDSDRMMAVATAYDVNGPYIAVNRLHIQPDHSLAQDPDWGTPYGATDINRLIRYFGPGGYCGQPRCNTIGGYAAKQEGFATPTDFYVEGSIQIAGDDWDVVALKISSDDGSLKPEFNGIGWSRVAFDDANSDHDDRAAGIYVYQDEVYMAAQVARHCFNGIGVARLDGASGAFNPEFGGGKIVFGGQGDSQFCLGVNNTDVPFAMSATGGRLGIVGYNAYNLGQGNAVDPMLAVVDAVDGSVIDFASHPVTRADGSRAGDAVLYGVYGGPDATSPFTVAGNGRDTAAGNTLSYLSGTFAPASADPPIFADGFDP